MMRSVLQSKCWRAARLRGGFILGEETANEALNDE